MSCPQIAALRAALVQCHHDVMQAEAEALACLQKGDLPGHADGMHRKAQLLADLKNCTAPLLAALPDSVPAQERERLRHRLHCFSASATNALRLDSLFYMSALLYPEDHQPGQPDDLLTFIHSLDG